MDNLMSFRIMMTLMNAIPISLYVHIPWCIKKCPYCDFNSHVARRELPESHYLEALVADFKQQLSYLDGRQIKTIFIGGGTPSLMSADFYQQLLANIRPYMAAAAEITLEANPGAIDSTHFAGYRDAGINRLSIGIQSMQTDKLKYLGRMHSAEQARAAISLAKRCGFERLNCDLMFGLPQQTIADALCDLQAVIDLKPSHLSWYQLTIEPNTYFYRHPPKLPHDDYIFEMQQQGQHLLAEAGFQQYEISAYAQANDHCQHNLNYWLFGDYLGIGAGAHGKITRSDGTLIRTEHHKNPQIYMQTATHVQQQPIEDAQKIFEFMLNALRLYQAIAFTMIEERIGIDAASIMKALQPAIEQQLLEHDNTQFWLTPTGYRFVDEIMLLLTP